MPLVTRCLSSLALALPLAAAAGITTSTDPNGLQSWHLQDHDFSLQLIQRLPDQTRAFFQARGFSQAIADKIATACVLQAIGKNTSHTPHGTSISYRLADWKIRHNGKLQGIKLKSDWEAQWRQHDSASKASRIAFRWATFPSQQRFEADGDFNWGMISFGLPPGSVFDLQVVFQQNQQLHKLWIQQIKCPQDR